MRPALRQVPGVGTSIASKIGEYQRTGTIKAVEELRAQVPAGVLQLTRIPALGPKRALQLYHELGISSVGELTDAIKAGRLQRPQRIRRQERGEAAARHRVAGARQRAGAAQRRDGHRRPPWSRRSARCAGCLRCTWAGSLRRMRETIGDIDILAAADDSAPLMAAFTGLPEAAEIIAAGSAKTSIRTAAGASRWTSGSVPPDCWGAALQYFTGSKEHNVAIREIAVQEEAPAIGVRPVRHRIRRADRSAHRGGGLPAARHGLDTADAARGHRRGPGRAARRAPGAGDTGARSAATCTPTPA